MVEHDIGVECAILETKELVCGRLAVFISNRRRSPDIKYGCVSMLPLCGDVSGVSNSDMVRPYEHTTHCADRCGVEQRTRGKRRWR